MTRHIITEKTKHPVQPKHIDASQHFGDAFGNYETEISAGHIVRFCQERKKGWKPFTYEEIEALKYKGFSFNRLLTKNWIIEQVKTGGNGKYYITHEFVARCFLSSPSISYLKKVETPPEIIR